MIHLHKLPNTKRSAQALIGIHSLTDGVVRTTRNTMLVFIRIHPVNVAVLPPSVLEAKVAALADVLSTISGLEILCLNAAESYEDNKQYLQERLKQENNPAVRHICELDIQHLDDIQQETATSREFYCVLTLHDDSQISGERQRLEKALKEQGFDAVSASQEDIKQALAVYYRQQAIGQVDGIDGERWLANA